MKFPPIFFKFFFLFLFITNFSVAQKPIQPRVNLENDAQVINLCSKSSFIEDKTGKLSFEEVEHVKFQDFKDEEYNFHFSPSTFWIKFTINSKLKNDYIYIVQVSNWYIDVADLYVRNEIGQVNLLKEGDLEIFSKKTIKSKYPSFSIKIKSNSSQTFYLKIKNSQYNNFKINLVENLHYLQYKEFGDSRELILGLILMRFAFHISLLFYMFYDKNFRAYSYWGILLCFVYYFSGGYASFVFSSSPYLSNLAFYFTLSFVPGVMSFYIYSVFEIKKYLPKIKWLFIAFGAIGALNLALNMFFHHAYLSHVFIGFMAFFVTFQLLFSTWFYFKIHKPSFWYISPLIVYLPAFSAFYLRNAGFYNFTANFNIVQFTFFLDFISIPFITGVLLKKSKIENLKLEDSYFKGKIETEKLQELDTLKTTFFTNISHEFRTPLTLLVAPLADLSKKFPNEWGISVMQKNVTRLQNLINQFLDLSKLEAGKLEVKIQKGDMAIFMKQLIASFESLAQSKQIIFQFNQNLKQKDAFFDAEKTETIINNLLSNAFKFTPQKGRVLVDVVYENDFVKMTVQDFGIGIKPEMLPFIFDRFYQANSDSLHDGTHQNYEGTGIGLALVKELVGVLKGQISVKSELKKGTEFQITLPIDKETWKDKKIIEEAILIKNTNDFSSDIHTKSHFIEENNDAPLLLLVEDNADIRTLIKRIFSKNYQIIEAENGQIGLEKAFEIIPDIVITDLMMPVLDGMGFCKNLKSDVRTSHIPVVMLTAKATIEDRLESLELGADDYLTKPFETEELKARVRNLVTQRENLRQKYSQLSTENAPQQAKIPSMDEKFLIKAKEIIEKNMSDSGFDLEQFCEAMSMSRATMHRKLKAISDQTTSEFIRNLRLQKAANLLKQKAGTVSEIGYQVGFENLPYFSKTFQEYFGVSPSDWGK